MSEIRERAQRWIDRWDDTAEAAKAVGLGALWPEDTTECYAIITDLLAELERMEKWKEAVIDACVVSWVLKKEHENNPKLAVNDLCVWCHSVALDPAVSSDAKALHGRIAELDANLKHVQGIAKATMDKLPGRWNMGFQAGLKQAVPHEKVLTDALSEEKKARKDDNAAFTEDILRLEAENNRLNTLIHKASQKSAEDFTEYIKDARTQAARECVEIIDKYPAFLFGADAVGVKLNLSQSIKARFGLDG